MAARIEAMPPDLKQPFQPPCPMGIMKHQLFLHSRGAVAQLVERAVPGPGVA